MFQTTFWLPDCLIATGMSDQTNLSTTISINHSSARGGMQGRLRPLDSETRQRLILNNLAEVRRIARRIHARLPAHVLFEDIVHSGVLGLIDAVDKFDPAKNVPLKAYAPFRIRGAILDSLRGLDWSPRSLRQQARRIEVAHNELIAIWGRVPSEPEIAAQLGLRLDKFQHILAQLHSVTVRAVHDSLEMNSEREGLVAPCNV